MPPRLLPVLTLMFAYNPVPGLWGFKIGWGVYGAQPCGLLRVALSLDWCKTGSWSGSLLGRFLEALTGLAGILKTTGYKRSLSKCNLTLWD